MSDKPTKPKEDTPTLPPVKEPAVKLPVLGDAEAVEAGDKGQQNPASVSRRGFFGLGAKAAAAAAIGGGYAEHKPQTIAEIAKAMSEDYSRITGRPMSAFPLGSFIDSEKAQLDHSIEKETGYSQHAISNALVLLESLKLASQRHPETVALDIGALYRNRARISGFEGIAKHEPQFLHALHYAALRWEKEAQALKEDMDWAKGTLSDQDTVYDLRKGTELAAQGVEAMLSVIRQASEEVEANRKAQMEHLINDSPEKVFLYRHAFDPHNDARYPRDAFLPDPVLLEMRAALVMVPSPYNLGDVTSKIGRFEAVDMANATCAISPSKLLEGADGRPILDELESDYNIRVDQENESLADMRDAWVDRFNDYTRLHAAVFLTKHPIDVDALDNKATVKSDVKEYPEFFKGRHLTDAQRTKITEELEAMAEHMESAFRKGSQALQHAIKEAEIATTDAIEQLEDRLNTGSGIVTKAMRTASQIATAVDVFSHCASQLEPVEYDDAEQALAMRGVRPNADASEVVGIYEVMLPENSLLQNSMLAMLRVAEGPGCEVLWPAEGSTATVVVTNESLYKAIEKGRANAQSDLGDFTPTWAERTAGPSAATARAKYF